jgi:hypothetical protein
LKWLNQGQLVAIQILCCAERIEMSSDFVSYELAVVRSESPELSAVLEELKTVPNGVVLTRGGCLARLTATGKADFPMLVIRSKRMDERWPQSAYGPYFAIDGCDNKWGGSPYLVWSGPEMSIAVATQTILDAINLGESQGEVLVAWVTEQSLSIESFAVDKEFMDYLYSTSRALNAKRFVPSDEYIESVHATFPPLLSDDEQRFIGEQGEPTYVARWCGLNAG